jgi:hypothetical protein
MFFYVAMQYFCLLNHLTAGCLLKNVFAGSRGFFVWNVNAKIKPKKNTYHEGQKKMKLYKEE